jgi:Fur family ferric uptake transcriptional regulator
MGKEQPKTRSLLNAVTENGFRLTSQRKALIETIQETSQHLDAATLLQLARKRDPRINRATVYRTLELLKKLQLVDELDLMHLAGEKHYYEVRPDRQHVHLACCRCGRIVEFSSETFDRLQSEIAAQTGFEIQVVRLEVGGNCLACIEATRRAPSTSEAGKGVSKSSAG